MWLLMWSISIGANSVYLNSVIYNLPMVLHFTLFYTFLWQPEGK